MRKHLVLFRKHVYFSLVLFFSIYRALSALVILDLSLSLQDKCRDCVVLYNPIPYLCSTNVRAMFSSIYFIVELNTSGHVTFCLLYKHANNDS